MVKFFGIDLQKKLSSTLKGNWPTGTLIKITQGVRTDGSLTAGHALTEVSYGYSGMMEDYTEFSRMKDTLIQSGDRKVLILAGTLQPGIVPAEGDKINQEGSTYKIVQVKRDGAAAVYNCQVRR